MLRLSQAGSRLNVKNCSKSCGKLQVAERTGERALAHLTLLHHPQRQRSIVVGVGGLHDGAPSHVVPADGGGGGWLSLDSSAHDDYSLEVDNVYFMTRH